VRRYLALLACLAACSGATPAAAFMVRANPAPTTGDQHIEYPALAALGRYAPQIDATSVGDVNGDGREDVAVTFDYAEPDGRTSIWVTFSSAQASSGTVVEHPGFKILARGSTFGMTAAGDANGDGLGDIAIAGVGDVRVVFGRRDRATIDLDDLGDAGFQIAHAGALSGGGVLTGRGNGGVVALGDRDGDGVADLLVATPGGATAVYLPRDVAGSTIDAAAVDARLGRARVDGANGVVASTVDLIGDVDGDRRADVLVAGEDAYGTDQAAYGTSVPAPGESIVLPAAVDAGKAFSIRTHDGVNGSWGELGQAIALGDQNGDGLRDIGLVCYGCASDRALRVVYTPPFGSAIDAGDLYASDPRGWSSKVDGAVVDIDDQNGDGVSDIAGRAYVYFPDPRHEPGGRFPGGSMLYFSSDEPAGNAPDLDVAASLADVNGDAHRELVVTRTFRHPVSGDPSDGETATYAVDVFDSATAPRVGLPDVPAPGPRGRLEVSVAVDPGGGSRGNRSLAVFAELELATPDGPPDVVDRPGVAQAARNVRLGFDPLWALGGLVAGERYRVRVTATSSRGRTAESSWREFTYSPPGAGARPAATHALRLGIGRKTLAVRDGRLAVTVSCGAGSGRCRAARCAWRAASCGSAAEASRSPTAAAPRSASC